jgi:hypothetical protein
MCVGIQLGAAMADPPAGAATGAEAAGDEAAGAYSAGADAGAGTAGCTSRFGLRASRIASRRVFATACSRSATFPMVIPLSDLLTAV